MCGRNCESPPTALRINRFLLCMSSPVLHKMLCGNFAESNAKTMQLVDVDRVAFGKVLDLWCGKVCCEDMQMEEIRKLAEVADRFQITEIASALDETVMRHLDMAVCGEVLSWSGELGLSRTEEAARKLATGRFEELAMTEGFMLMGEEALGKLLDDNFLAARNEEAVWEALVAWMRAEEARGRELVAKVRFPLMEEGYLRSRVLGMAPAKHAEWMEFVVAEALRAKAARAGGRRIRIRAARAEGSGSSRGAGGEVGAVLGWRRAAAERAYRRYYCACAVRGVGVQRVL